MFENKTIMYLYRNMRYEEFGPSDIVFNYGDQGDLFYIIMEGEVIVKTPAPEVIEDDQATPEAFIIYIIEYFQEIYWEKLPEGNYLRDLFLKEL